MKSIKHKNYKPNSGKILLLDDEEIVHLTLKRLLETRGYTIDSAYSGTEVLEKINGNYDLLILDLIIPGMDGIKLLKQIRENQLPIEVIILTGYPDKRAESRTTYLGARSFIKKPIEDVNNFIMKVQEAVELSQFRQEDLRLSKSKRESTPYNRPFAKVSVIEDH